MRDAQASVCQRAYDDGHDQRGSSTKPDDPAYRGSREYQPLFLRIYDPVIIGFFTRVVWRCPTAVLIERYRRHIRSGHLDVARAPATSWNEPACLPAPPSENLMSVLAGTMLVEALFDPANLGRLLGEAVA